MNRNTTPPPPLLSARGIQRSYAQGGQSLHILKGIDLDLHKGEALVIEGASGAGKSTLLHILGTLDRPTQGHLFFKGHNLINMNHDALAAFRNKNLGFVFQFHHLMAEFTALENVMMPALIGGESQDLARKKAESLLDQMGLRERSSHYPSELSGGEKQRAAVARALIQEPEILMADEPTGSLDSHNGKIIQETFFRLKRELGLTLIVVTHDHHFASKFPRVLKIEDGQWA